MTSAYSVPILVRRDDSSERLRRVPLSGPESSETYSEAWLQELLYKYPDALPIAELDESFSGMLPVCREMETTAGPLDVLYVTREGRLVILEAKLWRNPEARRKVIGQILDYAKELSRWNYETLDAAVRRARRSEDGDSAKGLMEIVGFMAHSPEAGKFHDSVTRSLRRGDFLLLIAGDGIREGVGAITKFLDTHASLHFTFGLVEMAIFQMPDGTQLVQPRVLAQSAIIKRFVVDVRGEGAEIREEGLEAAEEDESGPAPELEDTRKKYREFWAGFLGKLQLDDRSQPVRPAAKGTNQYFHMPDGTESWVSAYVMPSIGRAGVYLTFYKGPIGDRLYQALVDAREEIERSLGVSVQWDSDGTKHWISSYENYSGSLIDDHAEEIQQMMADRVNRFVNVFRPRLVKLAEEVT